MNPHKQNSDFCRRLLSWTLADVKREIPEARARDAGAVKNYTNSWTFELPDRPHYLGGYTWQGRADTAWHAKAKGWASFMDRRFVVQHCKTEGR